MQRYRTENIYWGCYKSCDAARFLTCTTWSERVKPCVLRRLHSLSQSQLLLPSIAAVNAPQSLYPRFFRSMCAIPFAPQKPRSLSSILDRNIMRGSALLQQLTFLNVTPGAGWDSGSLKGKPLTLHWEEKLRCWTLFSKDVRFNTEQNSYVIWSSFHINSV